MNGVSIAPLLIVLAMLAAAPISPKHSTEIPSLPPNCKVVNIYTDKVKCFDGARLHVIER